MRQTVVTDNGDNSNRYICPRAETRGREGNAYLDIFEVARARVTRDITRKYTRKIKEFFYVSKTNPKLTNLHIRDKQLRRTILHLYSLGQCRASERGSCKIPQFV